MNLDEIERVRDIIWQYRALGHQVQHPRSLVPDSPSQEPFISLAPDAQPLPIALSQAFEDNKTEIFEYLSLKSEMGEAARTAHIEWIADQWEKRRRQQ